jgi:hypothetical protein
MKTQKFTIKQLIPALEGIILDDESIHDAQRVLGHLFNTVVVTTEVPVYQIALKHLQPVPEWLRQLRFQSKMLLMTYATRDSILDFRSKKRIFKDFVNILESEYNDKLEIPQIIEDTK